MNYSLLIKNLQRQRYQVLVAVRPLASARTAWNKAIQALLDTARSEDLTEARLFHEEEFKRLFLEETL